MIRTTGEGEDKQDYCQVEKGQLLRQKGEGKDSVDTKGKER